MKLKLIIIIGAIIGILALTLFGTGLKEKALKEIVSDIPKYNCGDDNVCTSCIIKGNSCSCGEHTCSCGNDTVDRQECMLYS